jgi:hypothetical protein
MAKRKGFLASLIGAIVEGALESATKPAPRQRSAPSRSSRVRTADVIPVPAPAGWPTLPETPDGLDGAYAEDKVPDAARTYGATLCPTCHVDQSPPPRAKKKCRSCGNDIYVRSGLRGVRYLLAESQLEAFDRWRANEELTRAEATEREWHRRLAVAGFQTGDSDLDVVGESNYLPALAGIRAALTDDPRPFELRTTAILVREPDNPYDRNAIAVYLHGSVCGYLALEDAIDYQSLVRAVPGNFVVQAKIMGGRPDGVYVGPIGVQLIGIPEP